MNTIEFGFAACDATQHLSGSHVSPPSSVNGAIAPAAYRGYKIERLAYGCSATRSASDECQRSASEESILEHAHIVYPIHRIRRRNLRLFRAGRNAPLPVG